MTRALSVSDSTRPLQIAVMASRQALAVALAIDLGVVVDQDAEVVQIGAVVYRRRAASAPPP